MPTARKTIMSELSEMERSKDVRVLLAVEAGSRLWGFESQDSDYDVRFVYARPTNRYLSLEDGRDVIEWMLDDKLDIVGWDVRKFMRLMRKSNPTVFEWIQATDPYTERPVFELLRELAPECFDPRPHAHHYLGMARSHRRPHAKTGKITSKRYLYAVRATLAAEWACKRRVMVPTSFEMLCELMLDETTKAIVDGLVIDKKLGLEASECEPIEALDEWLARKDDEIEVAAQAMTKREPCPIERMDGVFRDILNETALTWDD